jgi:hypothetical protein
MGAQNRAVALTAAMESVWPSTKTVFSPDLLRARKFKDEDKEGNTREEGDTLVGSKLALLLEERV